MVENARIKTSRSLSSYAKSVIFKILFSFKNIISGYYEYMRKREEENLILKKMLAHKELEKQVDIENDKKKEEILDLDERTAEFYRLQDELYQYVIKIFTSNNIFYRKKLIKICRLLKENI